MTTQESTEELRSQYGKIFDEYAEYIGDEIAAVEQWDEAYHGEYASKEQFAQEFMESHYGTKLRDVPDVIEWNIDWEGVAKDLRHDYTFIEGSWRSVHVFRVL